MSSTFWNFRTVKILMEAIQIKNSLKEKISTTRKISIPNLMQELNPVVLGKYELEYRETLKAKAFFWSVRTIRSLMQGKNLKTFGLNTCPQVPNFQFRT